MSQQLDYQQLHHALAASALQTVGDLPDLIVIPLAARHADWFIFTYHPCGEGGAYVATGGAEYLLRQQRYWQPQPYDEVVIYGDTFPAIEKCVRQYTKGVIR